MHEEKNQGRLAKELHDVHHAPLNALDTPRQLAPQNKEGENALNYDAARDIRYYEISCGATLPCRDYYEHIAPLSPPDDFTAYCPGCGHVTTVRAIPKSVSRCVPPEHS